MYSIFHADKPDKRGRLRSRSLFIIGLGIVGFLLAGCAGQPSPLDPKGPDARQTANLWWLMFAVAAVVFIVVTVLLLIAIIRARRAQAEVNPYPQDRRALVLVIIGGAVIPAVVLIVLMSLSVMTERAGASPAGGRGTVEVIGHDWWWEVRYPDQKVVTANEVHIPVGEPMLVKVTSGDVIHSFWIPQLHGKIDVIPGQTNTIWLQADQPGTYRGECAEYCGTQHAKMDFVVVAESPADFRAWLNQQSQPAPVPQDEMVREGQQAFLGSSCVYCHAIAGTNASGTIGPDLTHLASRSTLGAGAIPNTRGNLAGWIVNSQAIKPGNKMPPMYLDSDQLQALLAYLETLK